MEGSGGEAEEEAWAEWESGCRALGGSDGEAEWEGDATQEEETQEVGRVAVPTRPTGPRSSSPFAGRAPCRSKWPSSKRTPTNPPWTRATTRLHFMEFPTEW